jgi:hypothetical protein
MASAEAVATREILPMLKSIKVNRDSPVFFIRGWLIRTLMRKYANPVYGSLEFQEKLRELASPMNSSDGNCKDHLRLSVRRMALPYCELE